MDAPRIKAFIDAMASSDLAEMEVTHDGWTLRLVRHAEAPAGASAAPAAVAPSIQPRSRAARTPVATPVPAVSHDLQAPLFGVVHLQAAPGAEPYARAGQAVKAGQTLAVIEAMKVFNEVVADRDGVVDAVLVTSGAEVDAGQPLLRWR